MKGLWQSLLALFMSHVALAAPPALPLTIDQKVLLDRAERTVKNYIDAGKQYPLFAMVMHGDGQVESLLASDEFQDRRAAFAELLRVLIQKARAGTIRANVLVTPMDPLPGYKELPAIFDLEQRGAKRILVVIPYSKEGNSWVFGRRQYREAPARLFAP